MHSFVAVKIQCLSALVPEKSMNESGPKSLLDPFAHVCKACETSCLMIFWI